MSSRGISNKFAAKFKSDGYFDFYQEHKEDLVLGVRDGYVNLYLNCDSISRVDEKTREPLTGLINSNLFISKKDRNEAGAGKRERISLEDLKKRYKEIKTISDEKSSGMEKISQSRLYLDNNRNDSSEWFCFDIEYVQSYTSRRFDILAITREKAPWYKVAVIEVKYGDGAISGDSGVRKHIKDFYEYHKNNELNKAEVCSVINSLRMLGVNVPMSLHNIQPDEIADIVEFYVITLNNHQPANGGATPKQKMGGQLFKKKDNKWGTKTFSTELTKEGDFYDLVGHDPNIEVTFLFFDGDVESLNIRDIINNESYDREVIKGAG